MNKDKLIITCTSCLVAFMALTAKSDVMEELAWSVLGVMGLMLIWYKR